ncbi:MAG: HU family DNA-binding protein [Proteobacteria bacterium]|nr:HU family DNA-binding protein [Pseudomonadota bacterium]
MFKPLELLLLALFVLLAVGSNSDALAEEEDCFGTSLNKTELIAQISCLTGSNKEEAKLAVDAVFDSITAALANDGQVKILGFGTFKLYQRAATMGRNPRTGELIRRPARQVPGFKPGKALKDAVNQQLEPSTEEPENE